MSQATWKKEYEFELPNGRVLEPGWTFKITGEKGKTYRFISVTTNPDVPSTWIDCFGGSANKQKSRAIFPEAINPASATKPKTRKAE